MSLLSGIRVHATGALGKVAADFLQTLGAELGGLHPDTDIILDGRPPHAPKIALDPAQILVRLTPFGTDGPYALYAGSELVCSALGGTLVGTGYEDRAPVKEALDACIFHAEGVAAAGALFALRDRGLTGEGQTVDVSVQEVAASRCTNGILAWQFDNRLLTRTGVHISYGAARVRTVWKLADGHCFHALMSGRIGAPANTALSAWMSEAGFDNPMKDVDWIAYNRSTLPADIRAVWEAAMDAFFQTRTKAEIHTEGRRRGINAVIANLPADVLADPHLAARDFFGEDGKPGRYVRVVEGASGAKAEPAAKAPADPPLKGVKVLDFSWALVGSISGKFLADHGATVVKVESATRPCLSRVDVQVGASKLGDFDDKPWFMHMNTSKLGLRLNMKHARWREVILPLIDWADVVLENFSPGTMAGFGLDYEALKARKPGIVMVSGSVYGQTGPFAREWGVDGTGAALSGRLALTGWPDRDPVTPSAVPYGDVVLPPFMAGAAAAALDHARRTGEGCHIDASMYEACVQQMRQAITGERAAERTGNADPHFAYQAVLPTAGADRWIAVSCADRTAYERLHALAGGGDIAAWTAHQEGYALMAHLQELGIAAGVAQTAADLVDRDPQLRHRGFLTSVESATLGAFEHQAPPLKFSRSKAVVGPAPSLGQHSDYVCRELAGLSADQVASLAAEGIFE
ncbi:MAG: CoA transferase [Caulobacteraceae bacterium]